MPVERFHLNASQKRKLEVGDSVQINRKNMEGPNEKERYGVDIDLTEDGHKKFRSGKGFRINPQFHYKGFGFLDNVKDFAKKHAGKAAETVKKVIPKDTMHLVIQNGLTAAGVSPDTASVLAASGTAAIYSTDFSKPMADQSGKILSSTVNNGVKQYKKNKDASKSMPVPVEIGGSISSSIAEFNAKVDAYNAKVTAGIPGYPTYKSKEMDLSIGHGFAQGLSGQTAMQKKMALLRSMRKTGGSFQGGGIKSTPTYLANHNGLNSQEVNNIKWHETHSATHVGGSFTV